MLPTSPYLLAAPLWPWMAANNWNTSTTVTTIDANYEGHGIICRVPYTGSIKYIWWRTGSVGTGGDLVWKIETVSGAFPSGTPKDVNCAAVTHLVQSADDNTNFYVDLTVGGTQNACAVTANDLIAVTVERISGTFNGQVNGVELDLTPIGNAPFTGVLGFPYRIANTTGVEDAWARQNNYTSGTCMVLEYSDGRCYIPMRHPLITITTRTYGSGDTPNKRGNAFQVPVPCWYEGAAISVDQNNTADFDAVLYDQSGRVVSSVSYTAAQDMSPDSHNMFVSASPVLLQPGVPYYLMVVPGATQLTSRELTFHVRVANDRAVMDALPGGRNMHAVSGSSFPFTADYLARHLISPLLVPDIPAVTPRTRPSRRYA